MDTSKFRYSDLHCHPNLKPYGHSFDKKESLRSDLWATFLPNYISRKIHKLTGVTRFSQSDFSTMSRAKAKIVFVSLYPFEKGYFVNKIPLVIAALMGDWGSEIGYKRVRNVQNHSDYFKDLIKEYNFFISCRNNHVVDGRHCKFQIANDWKDVEFVLDQDDTIAVILTIEGAHVFNCGLEDYQQKVCENEILNNIEDLKRWDYLPMFIGLAHNFNNGLCGHARSLQRLGKLVSQETNLNSGLSNLGIKVIHALLDNSKGKRIYIDLKHMSFKSRQEYYELLKLDYAGQKIPLIVSHGSVTGLPIKERSLQSSAVDVFNTNDLNFFDEEIICIARSGGLFAIQMDAGVNTNKVKLKRHLSNLAAGEKNSWPAMIIWNQIQHIAEVLDQAGLYAWDTVSIGSDFDGSINPFPGILTAEGLEPLANKLVVFADQYLKTANFNLPQNKNITAEAIVENFVFNNTLRFLKEFY